MKNNYKGFASLSMMVDRCLGEVYKNKGLALKKIIYDWEKIVGGNLYAYTLPYKISGSKKDGGQERVLRIFVANNSFSTQLHYMANTILERIASYVGSDYISQLRFDLKPSLAANYKTEDETLVTNNVAVVVDGIEDESLKSRLEAFGRAIVARSQKLK